MTQPSPNGLGLSIPVLRTSMQNLTFSENLIMNFITTKSIMRAFLLLALLALLAYSITPATACPFCGAVSATFAEEIDLSDMAVYAKLVKLAPNSDAAQLRGADDVPRATFLVDKVLKGDKIIKPDVEFQAIYFGEAKPGTKFLIYGASQPKPEWGTPIEMSARLEKYLDVALALPEDRGERAVKMQEYMLDSDMMVRQDAYNEFATTEYKDLQRVAKQFDLKQIRENLKNLDNEDSLLALNYTLLGICGGPEDIPMLEERLLAKDDLQRKRLDALLGCYLMLKGEAGLPLIETQFVETDLKAQNFSRLYRVLLALRFHGDDGKSVSKEKIAPLLRKFLDHPKYADLVIPDLARWQDWSVTDRVMELYRDKDGDANFVRDPAAKYMRICPLPVAEGYLAEMQKIDPDAYKRAMLFPIVPSKKDESKAEAPKKDDSPAKIESKTGKSPEKTTTAKAKP